MRRVAAYTLDDDAVRHAKRLIDARRYVLRSRWQDVQPRAREQNAFPQGALLGGVRGWASWFHRGGNRGDEGAVCVRLRRLPPRASDGVDRLPLPCRGGAAQGGRTLRARAPAVPRAE